jgi:hypothetical protein
VSYAIVFLKEQKKLNHKLAINLKMRMNTKQFSTFLLAIVSFCFITIFTTSCERNRCYTRGIDCQNGGTCFDGLCQCPSGFDGDSCQYAANKKFVSRFGGIYAPSNGVASDDTIVVTPGPDNNSIVFYHTKRVPGTTFSAKIKNNDITIASFIGPNGYTYSGTGSLNKDIITLTMRSDTMIGGIPLPSKSFGYTFAGNRTK